MIDILHMGQSSAESQNIEHVFNNHQSIFYEYSDI
jgi:hypothetical protein